MPMGKEHTFQIINNQISLYRIKARNLAIKVGRWTGNVVAVISDVYLVFNYVCMKMVVYSN